MEEVDYVAKSDKGSVFVFIRYWSQAQLHDGWFEEDDLSNLQEVLHEQFSSYDVRLQAKERSGYCMQYMHMEKDIMPVVEVSVSPMIGVDWVPIYTDQLLDLVDGHWKRECYIRLIETPPSSNN